MCEPTHSIIQFSLRDFLGNDESNRIAFAMRKTFGVAVANGINDGNFLTYSMLGYGHSEGISIASMPEILPLNAKYEGLWWNRKVIVDTPAADWTPEMKVEAMESAKNYADKYSLGSLVALRKFLRESLQYTTRPGDYIDAARKMLSEKGLAIMDEIIKDIKKSNNLKEMLKHVKSVDRSHASTKKSGTYPNNISLERQPVIAMLDELTKHREYMCPEWADDAALWT